MTALLRAVLALLLIVLGVLSAHAFAQAFPSRSIRTVVPFALSSTVGRQLSVQMERFVIVDNQPGALANLGGGFGAQASSVGFTLLMDVKGLK